MTQRHLFDPPCSGPGDYHAHVFAAGAKAVADPRYVPDYSATLPDYLETLTLHGLRWGTLVQPSFLGTDNSHLLSALEERPEQLRGVVVVDDADPSLTCPVPADWDELGVRGVRLNLVGRAIPALSAPEWNEFLDEMTRLGWHLEFQANAGQLEQLEPLIDDLPCEVVIDHLGLPETRAFGAHPLSRLTGLEHVWVKASAAYRSPAGCAEAFADALIARGFDRLVFGSDWPHTRFESRADSAWAWALRPEMQASH